MVRVVSMVTGGVVGLYLTVGGCTPRVEMATPDKPITINLNVKIDQEVRIVVDQKLEQAVQQNPDIF